MRGVAPFALLMLLVLAPVAEAAASGARSPMAVACTPDSSTCTVTDVAIVPSTSSQCSTALSPIPSNAPCRFLAGNLDGPRIGFAGEASAPTWTLWNVDGSTRQNRGADPIGCPTPPPGAGSLEDCDTDVTEVAISSSGTRIAVAARVTANSFIIQVFDDAGALKSSHTLDNMRIVNDIAMDPLGSYVAVAATVNSATPTGEIILLDAGASTERWTYPVTTGPATVVDLTNSVLTAGAGNEHLRFLVPSEAQYANSAISGTILDVDAAAGHTLGWSVVGHNSGFFAVYSSHMDSGRRQPSQPDYQKREASETTAANAVAIRDDATMFAVGHEGGRLRMYSLDPGSAPDADVQLVAERSGLGGIDNLAFSADGRYLVLRSDTTVKMYYTGNDALEEMWSDTRTGAIASDSIAVDGRGEHVVLGVGESIVVYDAIHRIQATVGTATQEAGTERTYQVQYRNDGNRAETLDLTATPPGDVLADISPGDVNLLPTASKSVDVKVDIPSTWPPGTLRIPVRAAINGGDDGAPVTNLDISVPTTHRLTFEPDGPVSVGANSGGPAVFDVTVRNDGNVAENVELEVDGLRDGWTATVEPEQVSLDPGESTDATVSVQPPPGLANGARLDFELTHGGVAAEPLPLTATVGAVFTPKLTAPVGTILAPGVMSLVNLTVRNDGNTRDGFVVKINALPAGWDGNFINGQSEFDVQDVEPCSTDPGSCSRIVQMTIRSPVDYASSVPVQVTLVATSVGDEAKTSTARLLVTVQTPTSSSASTTDDDGGGGSIPGPGPLVALLIVALAAVVRRRK